MEADFWHQRWQQNQIGFHESEVNPTLVQHLPALGLAPGQRVFVPLCGKTLDLGWLVSQGFTVAGAELSELAVQQLFADLGIEPVVKAVGQLVHYKATGIDIFAGDIFNLSADLLGQVDAIYDRAAMVALPEAMRLQYASHLVSITNTAPQLLITFEYDQRLMDGPPFCVPNDEVRQHYAGHYAMKTLSNNPVSGGLKGKTEAIANVWLLTAESQSPHG
jgi:thiopurine S-methyltransferase